MDQNPRIDDDDPLLAKLIQEHGQEHGIPKPTGSKTATLRRRPAGPRRGRRMNLLARLEAENAQLRAQVIELALQIQALRDSLGS